MEGVEVVVVEVAVGGRRVFVIFAAKASQGNIIFCGSVSSCQVKVRLRGVCSSFHFLTRQVKMHKKRFPLRLLLLLSPCMSFCCISLYSQLSSLTIFLSFFHFLYFSVCLFSVYLFLVMCFVFLAFETNYNISPPFSSFFLSFSVFLYLFLWCCGLYFSSFLFFLSLSFCTSFFWCCALYSKLSSLMVYFSSLISLSLSFCISFPGGVFCILSFRF